MTMKILLFIGSCLIAFTQASKWDYNATGDKGPADWKTNNPKCTDAAADSRQSPINIVTKDAKYNKTLATPTFVNYEVEHPSTNLEIKNNGHTVVVTPTYGGGDSKAQITYKGKTYELVQFHFHWGSDSTKGSEHTVDGKHYQVEVHFVHYNTDDYNSFGAAMTEEDGLLVYGQFLKGYASTNNGAYQKIVSQFAKVMYKDNTTTIPHLAFDTLLTKTKTKIYSYSGSLTTPTCDQSVSWIVNSEPVEISQDQMSKFLELKANEKGETDEELVNNYRPVQKLQQRTVGTNVGSGSVIINASLSMVLLILPLSYALF